MNLRRRLGILLALTLCSTPAWADGSNDMDLLGVTTPATVGGRGRAASTTLGERTFVIPDRPNGTTVTFDVTSPQVRHLRPSDPNARFDAYKDTADFTNFASADIVDGRLVRKHHVNEGTCLGLSYFTCLWYSRLVRPYQTGDRVQLFRHYDMTCTLWDGLTRDLDKAGKAPYDGVEYVMTKMLCGEGALSPSPFSPEVRATNPDGARLRAVSKGPMADDVKIGAIAHHDDQSRFDYNRVPTRNQSATARAVADIEARVEAHGTQLFAFWKYDLTDHWYGWDKCAWGHACLIYRVSEVEVRGSGGAVRRAKKLHFYDPNKNYDSPDPADRGEGYGTDLLYFEDAKQLTFAKSYQQWYDIQTRCSTIDDREVKFAYPDVYEGHPVQTTIAKEAWMRSYVGLGRVLADDELEKVNRKGSIKLPDASETD